MLYLSYYPTTTPVQYISAILPLYHAIHALYSSYLRTTSTPTLIYPSYPKTTRAQYQKHILSRIIPAPHTNTTPEKYINQHCSLSPCSHITEFQHHYDILLPHQHHTSTWVSPSEWPHVIISIPLPWLAFKPRCVFLQDIRRKTCTEKLLITCTFWNKKVRNDTQTLIVRLWQVFVYSKNYNFLWVCIYL